MSTLVTFDQINQIAYNQFFYRFSNPEMAVGCSKKAQEIVESNFMHFKLYWFFKLQVI